MTSEKIRQAFLDFFISKGHTIVPSASIVIKDDPTLLFTNAGMNQFKDYFLNNKQSPYKRVADTQKCLRVSGKHNDLEEVGVDTYHHTMFEMLGNWSFGDYFKEDAIAWSYELLTRIYNIPPDQLYVTVFEGDENEKIDADHEAISFWKKWIPEERIIMGNKKDNFWEMGETGPCGPCTEIHVDCRTDEERKLSSGKLLVNNDHPQVIEIWNNVFIQFNRKKDGSLEPLPQKHVDTGMGLERLVRVLQQKNSNYDTDVFSGTIALTESLSNKKYGFSDSKSDVAFRVIADHIRAIAFPISDGQLPSNTGAGYVIRRILRRAVRYYFSYLDVKQPLLHKLIPLLATQFKTVFPALDQQAEFVARVIYEEENNFLRTLEKGLKRIDDIIIANTSKTIDGVAAFELYDTYGFPIDLTRLIASENSLHLDEDGFEKQMLQQKTRSRTASIVEMEDWIQVNANEPVTFVGYKEFESNTRILRYRNTKVQGRQAIQLVLAKTPFYAESGGQVGDQGILQLESETIQITDTKRENDLIIHFTDSLPHNINGSVVARIDIQKRKATQAHHTATHLMHAALREVLGTHVAQKGSLVNEQALRFDVSHFTKITDEEIRKVEHIVNARIRENLPVVIRELPKEEAISLGAMALFGEKYGDVVRVVTIDPDFSIELCGGTHATNTGELGMFIIISEAAVGAGIRRIEALSGRPAEEYIYRQFRDIGSIKELLKNPKDIIKGINQLIADKSSAERSVAKMEEVQQSALLEVLITKCNQINEINFIGEIIEAGNPDILRKLCFSLKSQLENYVVVLAAAIDGKAHIAVMIDEQVGITHSLDASRIIKDHIAKLIKGGGGGQKTFATAGGQNATSLQEAIDAVRALVCLG